MLFFGVTLAWLTIPYGLAFLMPGRRSLAVLGAIALVLVLISMESLWADPGGHGPVAGIVIVLPASAMLLGALIRWLFLSREISLTRPLGIVSMVAGALVLPATLITFAAYLAWDHRAPSEACMTSDAAVKVAGEVFSIPIATFISLDVDKDEHGFEVELLRNPVMRRFCARSAREGAPIAARSFMLDLSGSHRWGMALSAKLRCARRDARFGWIAQACNAENSRDFRSTDLPLRIEIFSFKDYENQQNPHYGKETTFEQLQRLLRLGKAPNRFAIDPSLSTGTLEVYSHPTEKFTEQFFVFKNSDRPTDEPTSFRCISQTSPPFPGESCRSIYRLRNGTGVEFWFEADAGKALETFPRVAARVREILASMAPPEAQQPQ